MNIFTRIKTTEGGGRKNYLNLIDTEMGLEGTLKVVRIVDYVQLYILMKLYQYIIISWQVPHPKLWCMSNYL